MRIRTDALLCRRTLSFLGLAPLWKKALQEDSKFCRRNEVAATSAASVAAGQFGALVTQPFDVVKTLVQTDRGVTHPPAFKGPWGSIDAARQLHREAGFGAFWRGLAPRSLRCVLAVFVLGESQTLLDPLYERHLKRN